MKIYCLYCGQSYELDESLNGQSFTCERCWKDFTVREGAPPPPSPPPPPKPRSAPVGESSGVLLHSLKKAVDRFIRGLGCLTILLYLLAFAFAVAQSDLKFYFAVAGALLSLAYIVLGFLFWIADVSSSGSGCCCCCCCREMRSPVGHNNCPGEKKG